MELFHVILYLVALCLPFTASQLPINSDWQSSPERTCPFVYGSRTPSAQYGLINCTWYATNACCKRTEVTSVFSSMLPLYTPNTIDSATARKCRNLVNYMMCYFCAPDQADWYTDHVKICNGFCNDVYTYCGEAEYNNVKIGEKFANGNEFCQNQTFEIVEGTSGCFKFDPTVFDSSPLTIISSTVFIVCAAFSLLL